MGLIYLIKNKVNGKCYVGMTIKKSFIGRYGKRWWINHHNPILKKSIAKHGMESFEISILVDNIESLEELALLEKRCAIEHNSYSPNGYNLVECGIHAGFVTEETRVKRSISIKKKYQDPAYKEKHRRSLLGIKKTPYLRKPISIETRKKMADSQRGQKRPYRQRPQMITYNKTREWTTEMREKLAASRRGKKASDETKKKQSDFHKKQVISPEHRRKIAEANSRRVWSEESKQKASTIKKGNQYAKRK